MQNAKKSKKVPAPLPFQTPGEEIANALIHGIGAGLAAAGLVLLVLRAGGALGGALTWAGNPALRVSACAIYAASIIVMFLASTLYHALRHDGAKRVFRILDHGAIYLLIAGTYTPLSLICLRGAMGWVYIGLEWGLAAAGISLYAAGCKFIKKIELAIYILMGWSIAAGLPRLIRNASGRALVFLAAGGLAYTLGTVWYSRHRRRLSHVIWHIFVLAGALLHWFSIWEILG
ncbi:MAG: hemolysin III family protein [Treponema sp.]|jgi:hemolysin III|nr:hemolysin III family protein [Treponema sp.]